MPAEMYCCSSGVLPSRAKSKSFVARLMASGGSCEIDCGLSVYGWVSVVDCSGLSCGCGRPMVEFFYERMVLIESA